MRARGETRLRTPETKETTNNSPRLQPFNTAASASARYAPASLVIRHHAALPLPGRRDCRASPVPALQETRPTPNTHWRMRVWGGAGAERSGGPADRRALESWPFCLVTAPVRGVPVSVNISPRLSGNGRWAATLVPRQTPAWGVENLQPWVKRKSSLCVQLHQFVWLFKKKSHLVAWRV